MQVKRNRTSAVTDKAAPACGIVNIKLCAVLPQQLVEQGLTSHSTQFRSFRRRRLQVR